jgi:hypothetical protein
MKFMGRCWRLRRYRGHNFLECAIKDREYSFRLPPAVFGKGSGTLDLADEDVLNASNSIR